MKKFNILMVLYICRQWDGFAKACEGQTLKWVFPDKLEDYELVEADIPWQKNSVIDSQWVKGS
jgi:8-oxo-dGTP diphosphatase